MNGRAACVAGLLACASLGGCYGTQISRGSGPYAVGKWPFEAIAIDIGLMAQVRPDERESGLAKHDSPNLFLWGFTSLPFDLVFDVVLAPVDVVAWILGCNKGFESRIERANWERSQPHLQPR